MADYQYTTVPGKLPKILHKIRDVGVPPKATNQWLNTIGFGSSNDRSLMTVLKFVGFIDSSAVPTQIWKDYRGNNHKQVLANAIRSGYSELYAVYPDAHSRPASDIESVFKTSSNAGQQVIGKTVNTFQKLCELADFSASGAQKPANPKNISTDPVTPAEDQPPPRAQNGAPSLHIDIQIHIAADASTEQIDQIFSSMAKHLYKNGDAE